MNDNKPFGWNVGEERLLCHIVLDDSFATILVPTAAPAFFRGFIVQNRATSEITMRFRYKFQNDSSWYAVIPKEQNADTSETLRSGMEHVLREVAERMGYPLPPHAVLFFYPPDDQGDSSRTLAWLQALDLIGEPEFVAEETTREH